MNNVVLVQAIGNQAHRNDVNRGSQDFVNMADLPLASQSKEGGYTGGTVAARTDTGRDPFLTRSGIFARRVGPNLH